MKQFLDKDFLLQSEPAQILFHKYAENEPIFEFHISFTFMGARCFG